MRKQRLFKLPFLLSFIECGLIFSQISYESITSVNRVKDAGTQWNSEPFGLMESSPPWSGCLLLEGGNDYAQAEDNGELDLGDESGESFTVEAWINFTNFSSSYIVNKPQAYALYTRSYPSMGYNFRGLGFWIYPGRIVERNYTEISGRGFWVPGWHHVAGVYDQTSGTMMLYMDGERLHSWGGGGLIANSSDSVKVGERVTGQIDELRISNIVRYVDSTYVVQTSPYEVDEHTCALWHFDEVDGMTAFHDVAKIDNLLIGYNGARTIKSVVENTNHFSTPSNFILYQNYPNPFNLSTTIRFNLPKATFVTLKVYDLLSQEIEILVHGQRPAGQYQFQWIARNLPSGMYFYRLTTAEFVGTRKFILQR